MPKFLRIEFLAHSKGEILWFSNSSKAFVCQITISFYRCAKKRVENTWKKIHWSPFYYLLKKRKYKEAWDKRKNYIAKDFDLKYVTIVKICDMGPWNHYAHKKILLFFQNWTLIEG